MPNVISRVALEQAVSGGHPSPILQIAIRSAPNPADLLRQFPTEVRLMIFEELLIVWPKTVLKGARAFGPLDKKEYHEEVSIPWQILATCRKYYEEAVPIMYGRNKFAFCTGAGGKPGNFWRFPIHVRYMRYLADVGILLRADDPKEQGSQRVAHFMKALARLAKNLENLVVLVASDRFYEASCPWDIIFCDHPVAKALVQLVESKTVQHLKIRGHDGGSFFPGFAQYLNQLFYQTGSIDGRSITFSKSCTCPLDCTNNLATECSECGCPPNQKKGNPVEVFVHPAQIEADYEHMMDMQDELFQRGILPPKDDDDDGDDAGGDDADGGPYQTGVPVQDDYEEKRLAFDSGLLLPGQVRVYRGKIEAPKVWYYRQTKIAEFLRFVEYDQYLETAFRPAK